ncbi:non-specific serine/threonine protein kinase [Kibdelosporangium banguiense]|uniref:Non-specific serine/threonine protein kinase n=1 Tax=Kibdelosporangium banguiense TaxID=1365924 RepID=A0ABS4TRA5_9PSEU|nr:LuxR C-terminal-related transcriptional regulator [Kibdelosporangium banguiense]MBP2326940.1 non-specific serine/threonine protein kinase [Kibdelosporangium banguiense]
MHLPTCLPTETTTFVGRRAELVEARTLLAANRLLTLTGPGGVGKTRLALRIARQISRTFPDGVRLVEVDTVHDNGLLMQTVATALGLRDIGEDALDRVLEFLRDKSMLLVLDNCEHLGTACGVLVAQILAVAPAVRVLATSRHVLGIAGEQLLPVRPLPVPGTTEARQDAVTLFGHRAAQAHPDFVARRADRDTIAGICRRLDGMPLAIELAAAQVRNLSPKEILDRLDDRFVLLADHSCAVPSRQQTLAATVEWSYDLCSPAEQRLWERLSVFRGGFTLAAAETVGAETTDLAGNLLDSLAGLVNKSIVARDSESRTVTRYRMLETIREFGSDKLAQSGMASEAGRRHRDYFLAQTEQWAAAWFGPDQLAVAARTRAEHANIRSALRFSLQDPQETLAGARLAVTLDYYWTNCGFFGEARWWMDRVLPIGGLPAGIRLKALWLSAYAALGLGEAARALDESAQAEDLARQSGGPDELALVLATRAFVLGVFTGDPVAADACYVEAIENFSSASAMNGYLILTHAGRAMVAGLAGGHERAADSARTAIRLAEAHGELCYRSYGLYGLALAEWRLGNWSEAAGRALDSLRLKLQFNDVNGLAHTLELLAWTASSAGDAKRAAHLLGVASRVWSWTGSKPLLGSEYWLIPHRACESSARAALGERAFQAAFDEGMAHSPDLSHAIAHVLGEQPAPEPILTMRESQVAELVTEGVTNKAIATRLMIAPGTVQAHMANILGKLGLSSRSQIASWVVQHKSI